MMLLRPHQDPSQNCRRDLDKGNLKVELHSHTAHFSWGGTKKTPRLETVFPPRFFITKSMFQFLSRKMMDPAYLIFLFQAESFIADVSIPLVFDRRILYYNNLYEMSHSFSLLPLFSFFPFFFFLLSLCPSFSSFLPKL